ncbi:MAG: ATP-binding cassette domain-containing protein [Rhodococcus sp. (in: high G+C Gram-positive bacteria)]|uniref:ATP-binding cassette domain-containing protein n=1 Tax=Rhodococcus sp. TaxID=1831 RepID=UPI001223A4C1|nr:ATP-binding cassette domain-containing protein [Rhodococcus sp. (in: high G+C Gram-positive bacteria)]RZL23550.1 MAG: ATP-binding cassette domain-containing protein [Rhodococcus sp. (in: high G+C Gram-positive bacteria)]
MPAIEAESLTRCYGKRTVVDGVNLSVPAGTVHALLGPNGSGKTTIVRMLATLLRPSAGSARVLGFDTVLAAAQVKKNIGLVGQFHAVDPRLTGAENLAMFARLNGYAPKAARLHVGELLERFGLLDAADRQVQTYSGGMRRRLDIVAGMVVRPAVLFLDEPTTGLDPRSRHEIYEYVRSFVNDGTTVVLTTQYLDEADKLADSVTIIDAGKVVAAGTPDEIVEAVGTGLDVVIADGHRCGEVAEIVGRFGGRPGASHDSATELSFAFDGQSIALLPILRALDDAGIAVQDIGRRRATLDDAFLALTGHTSERISA